jgi:hypothetical protein
LYANLRRSVLKQPLEDWVPQEQFLGIIGTGDGYAVASKGGMGIEGTVLEFWKGGRKYPRSCLILFGGCYYCNTIIWCGIFFLFVVF